MFVRDVVAHVAKLDWYRSILAFCAPTSTAAVMTMAVDLHLHFKETWNKYGARGTDVNKSVRQPEGSHQV